MDADFNSRTYLLNESQNVVSAEMVITKNTALWRAPRRQDKRGIQYVLRLPLRAPEQMWIGDDL